MTLRQRLEIARSELAQQINARLLVRADGGEITEEEEAELKAWTAKADQLEEDYRSAVRAEALMITEAREQHATGDPTPSAAAIAGQVNESEANELAAISNRAQIWPFLAQALRGIPITGAEAELCHALNIRAGGQYTEIPWPLLFAPGEDTDGINIRVDAITSLSAKQPTLTLVNWLDRVFHSAVSMWLGVTFQSAGVGDLSHIVVTGGSTAAHKARGTQQDAAAYAFDVEEMKPIGLTARYIFQREDIARIPMLESHIRMDLSAVVVDQVEQAVFEGGAGLSSATGIIGALGNAQTETNIYVAANVTGANIRDALITAVDGRYAEMPSDVRVLFATFAGNKVANLAEADLDRITLAILKEIGYICRSSARVKDDEIDAANDVWAIASKARGLPGAAVVAVWPTVSLINDPFTKAGEREVILTATQLGDVKMIREENFRRFRKT